jgi:hypothetical protein
MTLGPAAHSIGTVSSWASASSRASAPVQTSPYARTAGAGPAGNARLRPMLTRRRAVDFCRVATALCQAARGRNRPVASRSCGTARRP